MRSSSRGRVRLSALILAAIAGLSGGIIVASDSGHSRAGDPPGAPSGPARLTVEQTPSGRPIPPGFLGLSIEYQTVEAYAGSDPNNLNPVLLQLIRNLVPGQSPVLRIGGDSADRTWWPVPGMTRPPGISFTLDQRWLAVAHALAQALDARLILGINLLANSPPLAAAEARALVSGIGSDQITALELGNEPELYATFPWYYGPGGRRFYGRGRNFSFDQFLQEYSSSAAGLSGPLAGPTTGGQLWPNYLEPFLVAEPSTRLVTLHRYPLQLCYTPPNSPQYPTLAHLLTTASSTGLADGLSPDVMIAHQHGLPIRIDELNSVSCGSAPGVSQTFAAALWSIDALFAMARVGVDGVNIHTFPGAGYELFSFTHAAGSWRAKISPGYYGLLMFAQAAPTGSVLLPVSGQRPDQLRAWATRAPDGRVRVVLINESGAGHGVVLGGGSLAGTATVERLQAPSLIARTGVTLGERSFGSETRSGVLPGAATPTITRSGGQYAVTVPAASAVMLTFMRNH